MRRRERDRVGRLDTPNRLLTKKKTFKQTTQTKKKRQNVIYFKSTKIKFDLNLLCHFIRHTLYHTVSLAYLFGPSVGHFDVEGGRGTDSWQVQR